LALTLERKALQRIDWAYLCFAWLGIAIWFEGLVDILPVNPDFRQFLFMVLWAPILLAMLSAAIAGFTLSILEWREWPLLVMTGTVASMLFLFLAIDVRGGGGSSVNSIWYVCGTAILFALCMRRLIRRPGRVRGRDA
jgi:hypothetical protein